ncbi:cation:proton antiporter domain-containing protein [Planctomicrobium piriforme]|uniref:Predicted Kef-type K+ transport protein, K+/H+ antiporter domain n=1 Tax=Planctomicrobium piriforme TaxID=1576369 RepID=A0A1I3F747_9PLAN|nr:cation:proton antiporter [Planctomicrobium piriforme]SFI07028.1 Predicted Kef-type K+ transport protein, K+/H+ antiporter domain [Planctomicrobium piriforme]
MHDLPLITTIAAAFASAWVLGLITQWMRLSPIVGYLLAGILIGPYSPGFVGDVGLAHQLAEVGVILLMFGVGLHFHLKDLLAVKAVALPGAIGQVIVATVVGALAFTALGLPVKEATIVGIALSVASTVVLMRVLMDANVLQAPEGHVAVGWLLVEDLLTVIVLVVIPAIGHPVGAEHPPSDVHPLIPIGIALLKLVVLVAIVMVAGMRVIPWALVQVARLRSRELFTLTVLVFSIAVAAGAYMAFGASMALGAFLAGMMVAQSPVSHQAAADALPLRDAFAVIFFVSVGMIFNPAFLIEQPLLIVTALLIVLIVKPLAALAIVALCGWSVRTALTVALGLAQVGEFSFILSDVARAHGLMSPAGNSVLVAAAMISITLNPLLFRMLPNIERWLRNQPAIWKLLNARNDRRIRRTNKVVAEHVTQAEAAAERLAVVIGYGPVGRSVNQLLRDAGMRTVIIDMNMDAVAEANRQGQPAIYGDGSREAVLEQAGLEKATHLVVTLPQSSGTGAIIAAARNLNPKLRILVRARYLRERKNLEAAGATGAVFEEGEAAVALARLVLSDFGASKDVVEKTVRDLRLRLLLENVSNLSGQRVHHLMVPWAKVKRLSTAATLDQVRQQVAKEHFSRLPVVDAQTGHPVGYLLAKDLVGETNDGSDWTRLMRPLQKVALDVDVESLLTRLQREAATICLVESLGRPVGLITIEDILEQVVGRIEDEYPRHPEISVGESLQAGGVKLELYAETPEAAITELSALIPASTLPPGARIAELALERERELSTDVGMGVAIPHARCPGLGKPVVVFGRSQHGIIFNAHSSEPVRFVFLLVTPAEHPEMQVIMLGKIAGLVGSPEIRQQLFEAATAIEVYDILGR